jgi:hypothetical protein
MRKLLAVACLAGLGLYGLSSASAMPIGPLGQEGIRIAMPVAGGCGKGMHRGPFHGCRRNWKHPELHACPRGYHIGPRGRCKGNGK